MTSRRARYLLCVLVVLFFTIGVAERSFAVSTVESSGNYLQGAFAACKYKVDGVTGKPIENFPGIAGDDYDPYSPYYFVLNPEGPVRKIVDCIDLFVTSIAIGEIEEIIDSMSNVIKIIVVLYVILLGFRLALGDTNRPAKDMVMAIIMAATVLYFMNQGIKEYYDVFKTTQSNMVSFVTATVRMPSDDLFGNTEYPGCDVTEIENIWSRFDCFLAYFLGSHETSDHRVPKSFLGGLTIDGIALGKSCTFSEVQKQEDGCEQTFLTNLVFPMGETDMGKRSFQTSASDSNMLFTMGTMSLFSIAGIIVMFLIMMSTAFIIAAIIQAVLAYFIAFFSLTFLAIIGPFIIPMALFQYTRDMFLYWFRMLVAYTISPALLFGYLAFMLQILQFGIHGVPSTHSDVRDRSYYNFGITKYYKRMKRVMDDKDANTKCEFATMTSQTVDNEGLDLQLDATDLSGFNMGFISDLFKDIRNQEAGQAEFSFDLPCIEEKSPLLCTKRETATIFNFCEKWETKEEFLEGFMRSLIILGVLLAVTVGFMNNVMVFGAQLAGLGPIGNITQARQVYNKISGRMASASSGK